ncbi:MAG: hypothetical protein Q9163_001921 [Psora crenata]
MEMEQSSEQRQSKPSTGLETSVQSNTNPEEPEECELLYHPYDATRTKTVLPCCKKHLCNECLEEYRRVNHGSRSHLCPFCRQEMQNSSEPRGQDEFTGFQMGPLFRNRALQYLESAGHVERTAGQEEENFVQWLTSLIREDQGTERREEQESETREERESERAEEQESETREDEESEMREE